MYKTNTLKKCYFRHFEVTSCSIFSILVVNQKPRRNDEFSNLDHAKWLRFRRDMKMFVFYSLSRQKVVKSCDFSGILKTAVIPISFTYNELSCMSLAWKIFSWSLGGQGTWLILGDSGMPQTSAFFHTIQLNLSL